MTSQRTIDFRYAPPQSWTSICFPDDPHKSLVREDGALLYGFQDRGLESWQFRRVLEFRLRSGGGPLSVVQRTESARIPVVETVITYPKAVLTLRTFAHRDPAGRRTDVVLWRAEVKPEVDEFLLMFKIDAYELGTIFAGRSHAPAQAIFAIPHDQKRPELPFFELASTYHREDPSVAAPGPIAFVSAPHPLLSTHPEGFRPASALGTEPQIARGGESVAGAILVPLEGDEYAHLDAAWAQQALEESRSYWQALPLLRLPIQLPDAGVMDMLTACARNILQAREIKEGTPVFQVGPTLYRNLFVVDGHFLLECAQYLGYADEAFAGLDALLRRARPNGAITEMEFHRKETGIALATLVRQCELMNREDRLLELWPVIHKAIGYIEEMRREAYSLDPEAPNYGLLPEAYADGGLGGKRAEYTTVFWVLTGLKWIGAAARRLGQTDDAERARAAFESLMADFRRCYARDRRALPDGVGYLPMRMEGSSLHHWIPDYPGEPPRHRQLRPQSAIWAIANAIYPGEIFGPDDPIVTELCRLYDALDDEEGTPIETGWLPYRSLWCYDASFAAHVWLYTRRPDKAIDYLYAFANHAAPTRVWREEQSLAGTDNGQIFGDMPHNWASAEFIRLVRNLLVMEQGESLFLLPGLPPEWRLPGAVTELVETPTRFGPVSLRLAVGDDGSFDLRMRTEPTWPRRPKTLGLMLPPGSRIAGGDAQLPVSGSGIVELPWKPVLALHGQFA